MIWGATKKRLAEIQTIMRNADMSEESATIIDIPVDYCPDWVADTKYKQGQVVSYKEIKYLLMQDTTSAAHYPPNMPNGAMLAIYKPYQGKLGYNWLYGEYCDVGYTRYDNGVLYRAIQNPNANIYPPSALPAVWEVV